MKNVMKIDNFFIQVIVKILFFKFSFFQEKTIQIVFWIISSEENIFSILGKLCRKVET